MFPLAPFIVSGGRNTERYYFVHVNDLSIKYRFNIRPKYFGDESAYTEVFPLRIKEILSKNTDAKIFCVFDMDTIYKYELEDEACCIKRSDNLYWAGAYTWKSPYDKMNTTDIPAYTFRFESIEEMGIVNPENSGVVLTTEYFTLSGTRTLSPEKGIVIRRRTLANGTTIVDKCYVK